MKKSLRNPRFALPLAAVLLLVIGAGLYGLPANGSGTQKAQTTATSEEKQDAWAVRCQEVENEGKKQNYCETFQNLSIQQTNDKGESAEPQRLIEMALGYSDGKTVRGVVILPLGVVVEEPLEIEIDGKNKFTFRVRYCEPSGCYAFLTLNDSTLSRMQKGEEMVVRATAATGQTLDIPMSLKGFAKALDKAKSGA